MQLTMKECAVLAFIFFASPAVGTMVNGAPLPLDARNDINRLQADPVVAVRAAASSGSSSGGGLLGLIGNLAPIAEDVLPMLLRRDGESPEPTKAVPIAAGQKVSSAKETPAPQVPSAPKGGANSQDLSAAEKVLAAHHAAEAHVKSVNELSSKLVNDPTARQKLYHLITSAKAANGNAAVPYATVAPNANHVVAQRAPDASSTGSSGGGLMGLIGDIAPFAEDILPMLARREPEPVPEPQPSQAVKDSAAHNKAVAALSSKSATDPSARAKAEQIAHVVTSHPGHTVAARAAASSGSSSGGGLLGLIGNLAPIAEDVLPMLL